MRFGGWRVGRWILVASLLLGWGLRLPPALDLPLHPDEALYGYWGLLIGYGRDPWLAKAPVYKPPLLPYLMAGVQALVGRAEIAVRLLGLSAGLLTIPLAATLARSLYRDRLTAVAAALGVALSPLAITVSATAFLDPAMIAWGLAACVMAARGRPGWAGLLAGLSLATKQTGLVWFPMVALLHLSSQSVSGESQVANRKSLIAAHLPTCKLAHLLACTLLVVGLVLAWDMVRVVQGAGSFWRVGVVGYGGLRLIWPQELWGRLREWTGVARCLFNSPLVNFVLVVGLPALAWRALTHHRRTREGFADLLLVSFSLLYFLLQWLIAFPIWDRYLMPLVPVLSILLGRVVQVAARCLSRLARRFSTHISPYLAPLIAALLLASLIGPAVSASKGHSPGGSDLRAYEGVAQVANSLSHLPEGSVVYHHWLGWHYHYYLFDAPVYLAYWPTPSWLARDVQVFGEREPRYITFPAWESAGRVKQALNDAGYALEQTSTATRRDGTLSFTVYRVQSLSDR